jgi:ubiquinone/menaquinone biosynthesis C-methylase UbiE/uncharacterized membrane protein
MLPASEVFMSHIKKLTISGMLLALGILLPFAFHFIPNGGTIFSPMHLPVLLCGFVCGPFYGAIIGLLCPLFSFLFTGMPGVAYLPGMMVELFAYGLVSGFLYRVIKTKNLYLDIYLVLIFSMIIGRSLNGLTNWAMWMAGRKENYSWAIFIASNFVTGWPGLVIQLIAVPAIVIALTKSHLISENDRSLSKEKAEKKMANEETAFFDELASSWDEKRGLTDVKLASLLDKTDIKPGEEVLDLACGTGLIDPYLLKKGAKVTGIDISSKMILLAMKKKENDGVNYQVADFYSYEPNKKFDVIVCFDAYPHFLDKDGFASKASSLLKEGGRLYIIHGSSKEEINSCHHDQSSQVISTPLQDAKKESLPYWTRFKKGIEEDEKDHYFLSFVKR